MSDERLYGLQGAEHLHDDINSVYETEIECNYEPEDMIGGKYIEVEEHTVLPNVKHFPDVDTVLEWIVEWTIEHAQIDEDFYEHLNDVTGTADVKSLFETALEHLASKIRYRMADKVVALHKITLISGKDDWEPLCDGEPLYKMRAGDLS